MPETGGPKPTLHDVKIKSSNNPLDSKIGRRAMVVGSAAASVPAVMLINRIPGVKEMDDITLKKSPNEEPVIHAPEPIPTVELENDNIPHLFLNKDTEFHARNLGLKIAGFIRPVENLKGDFLSLKESDEPLPLFHPALKDHKDIIVSAARNINLNPNIALMLASTQSAGNSEQVGGLFNISSSDLTVYADRYKKQFDQKITDEDLINPVTNTQLGLLIFNDKVEIARSQIEQEKLIDNYHPNHPEVYVRAINMFINGNDRAGSLPIQKQSESERNITYTSRIFFTNMELAYRMRMGDPKNNIDSMSDHDIRANLQSEEMNMRMWAITNMMESNNLTTEELLNYFSADTVPDPAKYVLIDEYPTDVEFDEKAELKEAHNLYSAYKESPNSGFVLPLNPWLRFRHATTNTVSKHIDEIPANAAPNAWSE